MRPPLADLTILAVEQFGAGPWATMQLADLGAEVIKIEDPHSEGDVARYVPPYAEGGSSLFFESFNRNKRSVAIDLRSPAGRRAFEEMVKVADAVAANLRGDAPAKLGLTYDALREVNPRIVCCNLSGFGQTGPRAAEPAYDYVIQAMAGWMSLTGDPEGPPTKSGASLVDFCGGYAMALALVGAVWRARRDGVGGDCDISLLETALSLLNYVATWAISAGHETPRLAESAHPSIVPFQAFETADGWITVACAKQRFWESLCAALDRPDLAGDPRFADFDARRRNRDPLVSELSAIFRRGPSDTWIRTLQEASVPVGEVRDVAQAFADPQVEARDGILEYEHPLFGTVRQPASPLRVSEFQAPAGAAPRLGEATADFLIERCGWTGDQLEQAREEGAFGSVDQVGPETLAK
jgi:crotonobetainyl-CoA:carnitine CoA-transferase CaiB-like acyl-CoA transferase